MNFLERMQKLFKSLGLNAKESSVFLKLLELGAQPISVIARYAGVPRSTMYTILDSLEKHQLVESFQRAGIKYVKCVAVKDLEGVLSARQRKIEQTKNLLLEKIPELEAIENKLSITPRVKFHEDVKSVMKMYEEVLEEKEFCSYFNPKLMKAMMPAYFYEIGEGIKRNKGNARELLVDCKEAKEYQKAYNSKKHQIKILPKTAKFPSDTIICPEKIYMISYGEKEISAIEIINPSLAKSQKEIFDLIWVGVK